MTAQEFLASLGRHGFVVMHEHGSLRVVPSDQLTPNDRAAIDRARSILVGLLGEREKNSRAFTTSIGTRSSGA